MDPRLAVHAGAAPRQKVKLLAAALSIAALTAPAVAAPKGAAAKAAFDRGVVAYQNGEFASAADALGTSFKLESDVETLFAWAQAERQLENCDKAIELFDRLLAFDLPVENKKVIRGKIDECRAINAAKQPKQPDPVAQPAPQPGPATPTPIVGPSPPPGRSPWWADPIGGGLLGAGVIGVTVGAVFLVSASGAESDSKKTYNDFDKYDEIARSRGTIGMVSTIAGGVLIIGGIVRYATRGGGRERATVSGWLAPEGGGGFAAIGRF